MKKLLSLAMAIVMLLSLAVPTVSAETLTTGSTGKDITVNYTPSSTSTDPIITGVSIEVTDGGATVAPVDGVYTIKSTSSVTLKVTGENLNHAGEELRVWYAEGLSASVMGFSIAADGKSATMTKTGTTWNRTSEEFEIRYSNDGDEDEKYQKSGIKVIYKTDTQTEPAKITGVSIEVKDGDTTVQPENGVYTIKSTSTVKFTVTGEHLNNATADQRLWYAYGSNVYVGTSGWTISPDGTSATYSFSGTAWDMTTTEFAVCYSNEGENGWKESGIVVVYDDGSGDPWITGISIEVTDGGEKIEAVEGLYIISPTSVVKITVRGRNLSKGSSDIYLQWTEEVHWGIGSWCDTNESDTTATLTFHGKDFVGTSISEIAFYNNFSVKNPTGIYLTYDENAAKVKITDMTLTVDGKEYKSGDIATITPKTESVTITFTGEKLDKAPEIAYMTYATNSDKIFKDATFNDDKTTATFTISGDQFKSNTTAFQLQYTLDGKNMINSGIYVQYQQYTTSVDIKWGALSFTYSDERDDSGEEKGWTCTEGADTIEVSNSGTTRINVQLTYTAAEAYEGVIDGGFGDKSSATIEPYFLETFTLKLSGKPEAALNGETIGTVTVSITTATDTGTEE